MNPIQSLVNDWTGSISITKCIFNTRVRSYIPLPRFNFLFVIFKAFPNFWMTAKKREWCAFLVSVRKAKVSGSHCFCDLNSNICIPSWTSEDCSTSTFEAQKLRKLVVVRFFSIKDHYSVLYLPNQNSEKVLKKRNKTRPHSLSFVPQLLYLDLMYRHELITCFFLAGKGISCEIQLNVLQCCEISYFISLKS